jgi:hypothetical protein
MSVVDTRLYDFVKEHASHIYKKPSAYKSGYIVKTYKSLGGRYRTPQPVQPSLKRWFSEKWQDVGNKQYPVYRPTIRVNKSTPLTVNEIDETNLLKQINLKQKIKGNKNLPAFKPKYNIIN